MAKRLRCEDRTKYSMICVQGGQLTACWPSSLAVEVTWLLASETKTSPWAAAFK